MLIYPDYIEVSKYLNNDKLCLDYLKTNGNRYNGYDQYYLTGVDIIQIWYNPKENKIIVKGSLPYFSSGHNFSFPASFRNGAINQISDLINTDILEAEMIKFEYGAIMETLINPKAIIQNHIKIPNMQTKPYKGGKYFEDSIFKAKLYNAGNRIKTIHNYAVRETLRNDFDYDKDKFHIKFENHYKKPERVFNEGKLLTVYDCLQPEFMDLCKTDLINTYKSIMKTGLIKMPTEKADLTLGKIAFLLLKEIGMLYDFSADELIKAKIKAIPNEVMNKADKDARKRTLKKMSDIISGNKNEKSIYDISELLESSLKNA